MGVGYTSQDGKVRLNVGGASTGKDWGVNAGFSYTWN